MKGSASNSRLVRRMILLTLSLGLLVIGAALPALAWPSVGGPTGLILTPTADTLHNGGFNFGLFRRSDVNYLSFNMSMMDNLEFGVTGASADHRSDVWANVKFRLVPESRQYPAVAVGVTDLLDDQDRGAYVVITKTLPEIRMRGSLGVTSRGGLIASVAKELNSVSISSSRKGGGPGTTFMAEIDGSDLNLGVGIGLTPNLRANVYLVDMRSAVLGVAYESKF